MFKILVVEDDKELNHTVCSFLNQSGYQTEGCLNANNAYIFSIIIGVIGMIGVIAAYPLYLKITKKQREKLAPEIMRLSEELMK